MTCSPGCKHIFEQEPHKYMQMWWPAEAYLSGEFGEDPIAGMFKYTGLSPEEDGRTLFFKRTCPLVGASKTFRT